MTKDTPVEHIDHLDDQDVERKPDSLEHGNLNLMEVGPHQEHPAHDEEPRLRDLPLTFWNLGRIPLLAFIRLYQATFSRALPPDTCRFYPTCSHYGYQAIYKYGAIKGGVMATWRVLRCNPFNPGGIDPVP